LKRSSIDEFWRRYLTVRLSAVILVAVCIFSLIAQKPAADLSSVKVVSLYESITDTDVSTLIGILEATRTDLIFRAYFRGFARGLNSSDYSKLASTIKEVRAQLPWIQVMGGITCSVVYYPGDYWPNGTLINQNDAKQMFWLLRNGSPAHHPSFPWPVLDITKPLARQFIEKYVYRFVDAGIDSIFFDEVDIIPNTAFRYGLNISEQPYIESWKQIVESVKDYARRQYGRTLLVTLNTGYVNLRGEPPIGVWPNQDFISVSFNTETIRTGSIQDDWNGFKAQVERAYGRLLPIMAFIDWGGGETPLSIFASLPRLQQIKLLKLLHDTARSEDLLLVYPLHGGAMNGSITHFDADNTYDAIKQRTYDTILQLIQNVANTSTRALTANSEATWPAEPNRDMVNIYLVTSIGAAVAIGYAFISRRRRHSRIDS
jgi:hypothetical protein